MICLFVSLEYMLDYDREFSSFSREKHELLIGNLSMCMYKHPICMFCSALAVELSSLQPFPLVELKLPSCLVTSDSVMPITRQSLISLTDPYILPNGCKILFRW